MLILNALLQLGEYDLKEITVFTINAFVIDLS